MSSFKEFTGDRRSSVADTCNRLSRFLKERGSLGLDLAGKLDSKGRGEIFRSTTDTHNSRDKMGNSAEKQTEIMDLFPHHAGDATHDNSFSSSKQAIVGTDTAPMTIFYGGKLFVFDDFPAKKVEDIMDFAMKDNKCPSSKLKPQLKALASDLPIMRRASLHRFMDKRRDRAVARAPYPLHGGPMGPSASSTKNEEQLALKL